MGISVVIDVGSGHLRVCGRRRAQGRQPEAASFEASTAVWAGADGDVRCAGAARRAALSAPEQEVIGWVHRLGDPVPFHTAAGPLTGAQLARQVLRRPVAEVLESLMEPSSSGVTGSRQLARVGVLVPDHWPVSRVHTVVEAVRDGVAGEAAAPTVVEAVRRGTAVRSAMTSPAHGSDAPDPEAQDTAPTTLVLDVGAGTVRADVIDQNLEGVRSVRGVQQEALGGDALDDVVLRHVLAQLPGELRSRATTPEGRPELVRLRAACREARETLSVLTEAVVSARFGEVTRDVRLVRHELETLIEPQLEQILDVGHRALEAAGATPGHVVLIGGTARTPRLVQLASARWSMPVDRPETPDNVLALAALDLVEEAEASAAPVVAVPSEESGPQTEVTVGQATTQPTAPRPGPETGPDDTAELGGLALLGLVDLPQGLSDELSPAARYLDEGGAGDERGAGLDEGHHLRHGAAGTPRALGVGLAALLLTGVGVAFAVVPGMSGSGSDKVVTRIQTETVTIDDSVAVPWAPSGLPSIGTEAESTSKKATKKKRATEPAPVQQEQAPAPAPVEPAPEQAPVEQQPAPAQQEQAPAPAPSTPAPSTPTPTGPTSSSPATSGTTTPTTTGGGEPTGTLDPTGDPTSEPTSEQPTTDVPTSGSEPTTGTTSPTQDGSPSDQGGEATAPDTGGLGSGPDPAP